MDIGKLLHGLRLIGLPNALRAVRYARQRDQLEKQYGRAAPVGEWHAPGRMLGRTFVPGGGNFRFERAELEIQFLAPDLVLVTWTPGVLPIPYALAKTDWPGAEVGSDETVEGSTLSCPPVSVLIRNDGSLRFTDLAGRTLRDELPPERRGAEWQNCARLRADEHLYGLGERAARLNLRGGVYRLWNQDAGGSYTTGDDPLYICIPIYLSLHGEGSYLIFYENSHPGEIILDDQKSEAVAHFEGGALRYYLIPGPPARALERYTELTGRPPLPPRWALGYHQAIVAYKSEAEVRALAQGLRSHGLPASAIHLDLDYMDGYRTFTIDRRFPDLPGLARELAEQGIRLVPIIDAGIKRDPDYRLYREGLAEGVLCKLPDGQPASAPVWPGWCAFTDFTDPKARGWWGTHYPEFLNDGIAGFWHDTNEPAAFAAWGGLTLPLPTRHALEGRGGDHAEAHNLYALQMNRAGYEALRGLRPEQRPFILTRSGWAGVQRYAWTWTGDTASDWQTLRQTIATVLGLGLSGIPYSGPDVGGFAGNPSPELYLRWFQLATFLPFSRDMSAFDAPHRKLWEWGEPYLGFIREFLCLRYRLMPYFYTLAWEASQTGHPLVRPLFWEAPDRPGLQGLTDLYAVDDSFLLGDDLLVAPVFEAGAKARDVHLPPGRWYSFWDDAVFEGPVWVCLDSPLERIPLFVRAGAVLPTEDGARLTLHLYAPAEGDNDSLLYCDAGDGYGDWLLSRFRLKRVGATLELAWEREGNYPFPYSDVEVCLHGARAERAEVDGSEVTGRENVFRLAGPFGRVHFTLWAGRADAFRSG
ncbi:MAG: TIM-barrel domain-containing protein [Anaerolineales bacterium]